MGIFNLNLLFNHCFIGFEYLFNIAVGVEPFNNIGTDEFAEFQIGIHAF